MLLNLSVIIASLGLGACASMTSTQTARTLAPGKTEQSVGVGQYNTNYKGTDGEEVKASGPFFEYSYRRGLTEAIDFGAKLTIIGTVTLDGKYSLVEADKFAMSIGAGAGYVSISSGSGDNEAETTIIDLFVPLILSYDFAPNFSLYAAPRYLIRTFTGASEGSVGYVGGSGGVKIGNTWGAYLEVAQFSPADDEYDDVTQYAASIFWSGN